MRDTTLATALADGQQQAHTDVDGGADGGLQLAVLDESSERVPGSPSLPVDFGELGRAGLLAASLFQIEKSLRMAKSDLAARPIFHRTRDSIEAHLTIVFAALAVSRWLEDTTGWSVKKFVKTVRRYRTVQIQAGDHVSTAADPLPDDVQQILDAIKTRAATAAH